METIARRWIDIEEGSLLRLRSLAQRLRPFARKALHLEVGERGEQAALFHLRRVGYTVVAARWTSSRMRGDVDLIGWDGEWLCFVEVKTRTARDMSPAESAVDRDKQQMLRRLARAYLKGFSEKVRDTIPVRFDIVSVYLLPGGAELEVFRGAFAWR